MPTGTGGTVTHFGYDANGQVITMYTGGDRYFYIRNGQGDITGLVDEAGNQVVEYKYYTWGAMRSSTTGTLASTNGKQIPFRCYGTFNFWEDCNTGSKCLLGYIRKESGKLLWGK